MTLALELSKSSQSTLLQEFQAAIGATSSQDLTAWGGRTVRILGEVTIRRGKNFREVVVWIWDSLTKETQGLLGAIRQGNAVPHLGTRATAARAQAQKLGGDFTALFDALSSNLQNHPKETAPKLVAGVLGFLIGSGGVQGDGGVPDLDLLGGIGAHRSILTHSVISGIVVETLVLGILDLSRTVYRNLPENHDPLWEALNNASGEIFAALSTGLSAGIAYHLGVDATIDGDGTYKGLLIPLPEGGHDALAAANAAGEAIDAGERATRKTADEIEGKVFGTFREAAEFAKRERGWVIVRATDARGFRVLRKVPREGKPAFTTHSGPQRGPSVS